MSLASILLAVVEAILTLHQTFTLSLLGGIGGLNCAELGVEDVSHRSASSICMVVIIDRRITVERRRRGRRLCGRRLCDTGDWLRS